MALVTALLILAGVALLVGGYQVGIMTANGRKRELKETRAELAKQRRALVQIEDLALNNPDGFVLNTELIKITRTRYQEGPE